MMNFHLQVRGCRRYFFLILFFILLLLVYGAEGLVIGRSFSSVWNAMLVALPRVIGITLALAFCFKMLDWLLPLKESMNDQETDSVDQRESKPSLLKVFVIVSLASLLIGLGVGLLYRISNMLLKMILK